MLLQFLEFKVHTFWQFQELIPFKRRLCLHMFPFFGGETVLWWAGECQDGDVNSQVARNVRKTVSPPKNENKVS